jgi:hypothetical protein
MKFEEIFEEEGLYRADSFQKGFVFKIKKNKITSDKQLHSIQYKDENDLFPAIHEQIVYQKLFKKEYTKVFTIKSLF